MRRASITLLVAIVASGCGQAVAPAIPASGPTPSPVTSPTPTEAPSPSPLDEPSDRPESTDTPEPSPAPLATCPPAIPPPMTVATYLAYQPDCFGSNDVTLTGWEDIPVGYGSPEMGSILEPTWFEEPTAAMLMDFVPGTCEPCEPNLMVHVNPASTLHFESDGVYVVITGHRQDPAANTCHTIFEDAPAAPTEQPGESKSSCVDKFVLTSVRAAPPPSGALDFCPSVSTLDVDSFLHTDPVCFHGKTLKIAGWADALPPIDYDGPSIDPHWLSYPTLPFTALWSVKPFVFDGSRGCPDASVGSVGTCFWMTPEVKPNTGVSFTPSQGWVILTGHIDDPVAETCHYTSTGLGEAAILPAVYARQTCRSSFVITKVESATAPAS